MKRRLALLLLAIGLAAGTSVAEERMFRSGHPGEPDSLDPHLAIAAPSFVVINDLFEGLTTLDARGRAVPGAAESYTVSSDGRIYTFTLRSGLTWSDGAPLRASDFVYSFRRLADPATASTQLAAFIDLFEGGRAALEARAPPASIGVSAPDERTVRIALAHPAPYFAKVAANPAFVPVPRHVIERAGRNWARPETFVGNGPFVLAEWRPGHYVRTARNPRFRDARNVSLDGVIYRPITDQNSGLRLFLAGELDALTNFPPERLEWLRRNRPRELRLAPSLGATVYILNHRLPKFRDARVRRALSLAIDREALTSRIVRTGDRPAYGLVPPLRGRPALADPARGQDRASRAREARALLAAAGHDSKRPLEVELLYHTSEEHKKVAVAVASMWQSVGVRARLRNAERQVVEVATRSGEFEIVRGAWFGIYEDPNAFFHFLRPRSPANAGAYSDPAFETLLARADAAVDETTRARLMLEAERRLIVEQAFLPLYYLVGRRLVAERVLGWRDDNPTAFRPARYLSLRP